MVNFYKILSSLTKNRFLLLLLLLAFFLRIILTFLPGFQIDMNDWFAWALRLAHFDFSHFYNKDVFTDYTPGYLYVLSILGFFKNLFSINDSFFYLLLKLPAIISELIIGLLLYKEIKKLVSKKWAVLAFIFILFNPSLIFNSSIWGQIDSILTLLVLISIVALRKNNLIISSIFFGLALLVKPQALALLPLFAFFLIKHFRFFNLLKIIVPGFLIIFILTFPFFPNQTLINLAQHILNTANEYSYTSVNTYNLWGVVGFWITDKNLWNNLSYQTWGYLLLTGYWMILGYFYFKQNLSIYSLATLATLSFFFLPTRVHERYLYPAIIFLILTSAVYKSKLLAALTGILSLLHFLNLYYVYIYYNQFYFKLPEVIYNPIIYNFLAENSKNLSLISTIVFIFISISIIRKHANLKKA